MSENNGKSKPAAKTVAGNILDFIDRATEEDLATIDTEIDALNKRLAALQGARKLIEVSLFGPKKRKAPTRKAGVTPVAGTDPERGIAEKMERRKRIAKLLGTTGPLPAAVIGEKLDLDGRGVASTLGNCDWFEQTGAGYRLTSIGRREALAGVPTPAIA